MPSVHNKQEIKMATYDDKFKLSSRTKVEYGITFFQIQALRNFDIYNRWTESFVEEDEFGGWVENDWNLSQKGTCWIGEDAMASGNSKVLEDAQLYGNAYLSGYAVFQGNSVMRGNARASGLVIASENTLVEGDAVVHGAVCLSGNATVGENTNLDGCVKLYNRPTIFQN